MMEQSQRAQTIAISAICQSAQIIQQIAKGQAYNKEHFTALLSGIMVTSPKSVFDVYPDVEEMTGGCELLIHQLSGQTTTRDVEVTRYIAGIMALSKKLLRSNSSLSRLTIALENIERRLEHFEINSGSIVQNFADAYREIVSPLGQKIQVIGNPEVLKHPDVQNKVRALLFAGVRAAVLWRQLGGQRRQFLFNRKRILQDALSFKNELTSIS